MKHVIIVHGWGGNAQSEWFPWLKRELESRGVSADALTMPNTEAPEISHWVTHLAKSVHPGDETYLVGHSMGCQAILRYIEKSPATAKISGALLVAGFITSLSDEIMKNPEEAQIAQPWLETPLNLEKIHAKVPKIISILSDDDPYIPEDNWEEFRKLGEALIEHGKRHFNSITEPIILETLLEMMEV